MYVRSEDNPADLPTKGMTVKKLTESKLWSHGPWFLQEGIVPDQPEPQQSSDTSDEMKQAFKDMQLMASKQEVVKREREKNDVEWREMVREKMPQESKQNQAEEYMQAEQELWKQAQLEAWPEVIQQLKAKGRVNYGHKLAQLNPQLDESGVLRVRGRLRTASDMEQEQREPVLLPKDHPITRAIVTDVHCAVLKHAGGSGTLFAQVMNRYWIPQGKSLCKGIVRGCLWCKYNKARPQLAQEAPVPYFRKPSTEQFLAAFSFTGVDAAGPWKVRHGRGTEKKYVLLFVCTQYTAIHCELVSDLSTASFLMAFHRFTARRASPVMMLSDNGTNFTSGSKVLKELISTLNQQELVDKYPEIHWAFNTPHTPHQGGLWERAVGLFKRAVEATMPTVLQGQKTSENMTSEQLQTVFTVAEGLVNQRPLGYTSTDAEDLKPITPAHFLCGQMLRDYPMPDDSSLSQGGILIKLERKYRRVQEILNQLWRRYIKEVLPNMQVGNKRWSKNRVVIKEGDVVVVLDPQARGQYPLGRVVKVWVNKNDGIGRVMDVVVHNKVYRRSLSRLFLLVKKENIPNKLPAGLPDIPPEPKSSDELQRAEE